jgi:hypothetical protein
MLLQELQFVLLLLLLRAHEAGNFSTKAQPFEYKMPAHPPHHLSALTPPVSTALQPCPAVAAVPHKHSCHNSKQVVTKRIQHRPLTLSTTFLPSLPLAPNTSTAFSRGRGAGAGASAASAAAASPPAMSAAGLLAAAYPMRPTRPAADLHTGADTTEWKALNATDVGSNREAGKGCRVGTWCLQDAVCVSPPCCLNICVE